jgi:hypothetical protein
MLERRSNGRAVFILVHLSSFCRVRYPGSAGWVVVLQQIKPINQMETGKAFGFYVTKGTMVGRQPVQ